MVMTGLAHSNAKLESGHRPTSLIGLQDDYLARAKALSPLIEEQASQTEQAAKMTEKVVQAFRDSKLFWMNVPKELNGGGLDLHTRLDVLEELARADGSTGWAFMAIAG